MGWAAKSPQSARDRAAMDATASVREVSEYQIFIDAYRDWHGRAPEENSLERDFGHYLRCGEVPEFVRHYLRTYGNRNPERIASYRRALRKAQRIRQLAFWLIVLMVIVALAL